MFLRTAMFPSAGSAKATRTIVNAFAQASWTGRPISPGVNNGAIASLSGSMTAATLKTLLNISGSSVNLTQLTFRTADATARTIQVKITIDGFVACNATSASISAANTGCVISGSAAPNAGDAIILPPIKANSTLLIEYASSLTETDKITAEYAYNTEA